MKKHDQEGLNRDIIIALHETAGIGWHTIRKVVEYGDWPSYIRYEPDAWRTLGLRPEQAAAAARSLRLLDMKEHEARMSKLGITVITRFDSGYPELLRYIPQPPWVLYAIGRLELLPSVCISIVGTRGPTAYGRKIASELSEGLSKRCITVVSGLARGIDSVAHEGALRGEGGTIAVLGTPVNVIYPPENRGLYRTLAAQGLILSEVPLGTAFHPGHFPLRNRIIAGLSIGTVVVEAAEKSGSLITADQALEMNREVFAVPGPISSPKSAGTNKLIRESGAKLISNVEHITEEFIWLPARLETKPEAEPPADEPLTGEEELLYRLLLDQPRSTDELHELSSLPFGLLHSVLINLSIKRKIEQQPGSIYRVT
ncbi:DNA-processing protein DprA [Paenibacillus spongiae]|uniref:DNA-processing protein DprA n=1 Tax=Paenibacillus spongiae TaxID=2909671 RepID=A0ABY5SET2_9BACL|nr:DNA-processing protein DprA [Paenibacillus spongiae]UVI32486.1 DNA-processing protein DprA [Paenibacillus spongiae]